MPEPKILDLDILRPPAEYVRLGGKDIDISFIPSGVALDLMGLQDKLNDLASSPEKLKKIQEGGPEALRTFDISAEMCARITACQHPEMDKVWLLAHTSIGQLKILMDRVTRAVYKSLEMAEDEELKKQLAVSANP